jgi:hypothetical protein
MLRCDRYQVFTPGQHGFRSWSRSLPVATGMRLPASDMLSTRRLSKASRSPGQDSKYRQLQKCWLTKNHLIASRGFQLGIKHALDSSLIFTFPTAKPYPVDDR